VSAGASSRIAHRVAAAEEDGERRGETKMKSGESAEIRPPVAKSVRKSVYQTQADARKAAFCVREKMEEPFGVYDCYDFDDVPRALLAIDFLTNFYMSKNGEEMDGHLAAGFAAIAKKCAHAAFAVLAERDALSALAVELEEELAATQITDQPSIEEPTVPPAQE
jgi:hypothetical protein